MLSSPNFDVLTGLEIVQRYPNSIAAVIAGSALRNQRGAKVSLPFEQSENISRPRKAILKSTWSCLSIVIPFVLRAAEATELVTNLERQEAEFMIRETTQPTFWSLTCKPAIPSVP